MGRRILIILTSQGTLGKTTRKTGWYLPELAHPLKILFDAGYGSLIDIISPKGGKAPVDPFSVETFKDDPICQWLNQDETAQNLIDNTRLPKDISSCNYLAAVYPGGHGPMFDLATNKEIAQISSDVFTNGGIIAACCHGPAGLIPVSDGKGNSIVHGRNVTSFTNSEEKVIEMDQLVPFALESKLRELGANFQSEQDFQGHVVVDGRLLTGQNSQSSSAFSEALFTLIRDKLSDSD